MTPPHADDDVCPTPADDTGADAGALRRALADCRQQLQACNDELRQAVASIGFLRDEYTDIYDFAPIGYLTLNREGVVERANMAAAAMLRIERATLAGRPFRQYVDRESRHSFAAMLTKLAGGDEGFAASCEVRLTNVDQASTELRITAVVSRLQSTYRLVLIDITEQMRFEAEREKQHQRIAQLSHRLIALQEAERRKLGTELHDRTSGNLAALDLLLSDLGDRMPREVALALAPQIEDIKALLIETTRGIRDISADIRPALLDHGGLIAALDDHAARFAKLTGIAVQVVSQTGRRLRADLESALFRIAQEALTNCAKHSHARNIRITLSSPADRFVLTIVDDGYGFLPDSLFAAKAEPGLGIVSMRERAEFAGGEFHIRSRPGKGTRITVKFKRTPRDPVWVARQPDRRQLPDPLGS